MNLRQSWTWLAIAIVLLVVLLGYERLFVHPPPPPTRLLPDFQVEAVTRVEVYPAEAPPLEAVRTNGTWRLVRPVAYPAQTNSIEALLTTLREVQPAARIPLADLRHRAEGKAAFGLEPERFSIVITAEGGQQQLLIGALTPPGDQVFVQLTGSDAICVVPAGLLQQVPASDHAWRNTLVLEPAFKDWDGMTIATEGQVVGLKMDPTNLTWRLVRPLNARADQAYLASLMQGLRDLQAQQFITDDPRADLEAMGLQPPVLEISFLHGTNTTRVLRFGRPVNGHTNLVHAIGREPGSIVAVPSAPLQPWTAPALDFRDRRLVRLTAPIASVSITNGTGFLLRLDTNGVWRVEPAGWTADPETVAQFLNRMGNLRIAQFAKDVVAEPDLPSFGLGSPALRLAFQPATEAPALQLDFSAPQEGKIHVRRGDESAVYSLEASALDDLPLRDGEFRDRRIWRFTNDQVTSLTVQQGASSWQVLRKGANEWSLAPGSQGLLNPFAVEETLTRLSQLKAVVWTRWDGTELAAFGLDESARTVLIELKDGTRLSVRLGKPAPSSHVYAAVPLDGREWVFEFPLEAYDALQFAVLTPAGLR